MSTATIDPPQAKPSATEPVEDDPKFDPDSFRMTVGEHLEELRGRLLLAIGGMVVAVLACLLFSERVMVYFCKPLTHQLNVHGISPQVYYANLTDPFMTYLKVTMITAGAIAGPWMIYQTWLFVAAGLYPRERKMITRYVPLSVTLFVGGLLFVYYLVLPLSIKFFIDFSNALTVNAHFDDSKQVDIPPSTLTHVPTIPGDPKEAPWGSVWYDTVANKLKIAVTTTAQDPKKFNVRVIQLAPESMMVPIITIGDYIDLVVTFMLTFGVAFQLPLVMLALVTIGVVDLDFLRKKRRVMFFGMAVAAAFLAPGDIITTMLALLIPLVILYEFGLILVRFADRRKTREAARRHG